MIEFHWNFIKKSNDLSEIIDIVFQTINQQEIFYQRIFFLLIEEIVVVSKAIYVLLQSFAKI